MFEHSNFLDAFFYKDKDIGSVVLTSSAKALGGQGGLRISGWFGDGVACASGNTIQTAIQVGDNPDSTSAGDWTTVHTDEYTATGTSASGDFLKFIPDTDKQYCRVVITPSTGFTGKFNMATEYVPR